VPKRGIGLGPVGPEAKKWLEVKGIGLGPRRPGVKKGVNGFSSSNNRSHRVYLGFKIREPFFLPAPAPLQFHSLSLSLREALPSLSLSSSFTARIPWRASDETCNGDDSTDFGRSPLLCATVTTVQFCAAKLSLHQAQRRESLHVSHPFSRSRRTKEG